MPAYLNCRQHSLQAQVSYCSLASSRETSGPADATIHTLSKGQGQPLLLIHGDPETHVTWHKVPSALVNIGYQIVLPDLRGYGDTSKPCYSPENRNYSFRAMAQDMVDVMKQLGHSPFMVAGHDRGGRVVHRLCLDAPRRCKKPPSWILRRN